jgi:hypothetical protein
MGDVLLPPVLLRRPGVATLVGQLAVGYMTQHVEMDRITELGLDRSAVH